jgi:hypothetical protein
VDDDIDRGRERHRGRDHLVAGSDSCRQQAQMQGRRARIHGHSVRSVPVRPKRVLESRHLWACAEPCCSHARDYLVNLGVFDLWGAEDEETIL